MSSASLQLGGDNWAAKDGNLLGYQKSSSSSVHIPHEFTFTRGSNLAATRVAANGLIEKGRENLLLQSNNFDTTPWTTDGASVTSGQSGYDGSNDAWKLSGTGGSFPRVQQNKSVSGVATYSVYAKSGNVNVLRLLTISGSNTDVRFQLTESGSILTQTGSERIESKITRLGSTDWYKCSITFNGSSTNFRIYPMSDNLTFAVNGEFIYIQDAQLEQGLVATDYIETGATTVQAGLLESEPRIDYTGGTGSLLLEPSRTQLIPQTEYFEGDWSNTRSSLNFGYTSPQGTDNAYKLISDNTASSSHILVSDSFTISASTDYTGSIFVKGDEINWVALMLTDTSVSDKAQAWFNLSNGTKGSTEEGGSATISDYDIEDYGNGWYRIYIVADLGGDTTAVQRLYLAEGDEDSSFDGNGTDGLYIYGAQVEQGSYPTSYIPNHSGGSVTRSADDPAQLDVTSLTSTYSTLYVEFEVSSTTHQGKIALSDNSQNNRMTIYQNSNDLMMLLNAGGSGQTSITASNILSVATNFKVAVKNQNGSHALFINGIKIGEESSTTPTGLNKLRFGNELNSYAGQKFLGDIKQTLLFPTALSDAQCSALTVEGLKEEILTSYIAAVDTLEDGAEARLDTYLQNLEDLIV